MKTLRCFLLSAVAFLFAALPSPADSTFTFTEAGITDVSQIVLPANMTTVVTAVNVGSTSPNLVNGITFAADSGNWLPSNGEGNFAGNGYTAHGFTEAADDGGVAGADFTQTTINFDSTGFITGNTITNLSLNTDYVFQLYLSDENSQRGADFSYMLGNDSGMQDISQTLGDENLYQIAFNSGANTTFNWALAPVTGFHDGKVAAYALFSDTVVPEPASTTAILTGFALLFALARHRLRRPV